MESHEKLKADNGKDNQCEDCPNFTLTHWGYWCILLNTDISLDKIDPNCPLEDIPKESNEP
jgi:hypothetical protein